LDFRKGGLTALQELVSLPRWPEDASDADQLDLLREDAVIRDQFEMYGYAFDNQDLDTVLDFFTDDCVITNPRGQVSGAEAVRDNYLLLFGYWKSTSRHAWSNVTVRFLDTALSEAYVGAYFSGTLVSDERTFAGTGTDIRHLKKMNGIWKIAERWITDDVAYAISLFEEPLEDADKVEQIQKSARLE
jgi:ketosteroid isomerase-like protein